MIWLSLQKYQSYKWKLFLWILYTSIQCGYWKWRLELKITKTFFISFDIVFLVHVQVFRGLLHPIKMLISCIFSRARKYFTMWLMMIRGECELFICRIWNILIPIRLTKLNKSIIWTILLLLLKNCLESNNILKLTNIVIFEILCEWSKF